MKEISRSEVSSLGSAVGITDVEHLSSYNWIEATSPTIVVPGSPALWAPPGHSNKVKKDSGLYHVDLNAAFYPDNPMEPLFTALYLTQPSFDMSAIDVVTDRYNLRKLLSFVDPNAAGETLRSFVFKIEIHKGTAVFSRVEPYSEVIIRPDEFRGFGHEFEKVYTRPQINGSIGHYRIVSYRFGGLKFIVRHETDGCVGEAIKSPLCSTEKNQFNVLSEAEEPLPRNLNQPMTDLHRAGSRLVVRREGQIIPLSRTVEIKTRAFQKKLSISQVAPQIWISQTPKLVRAYYRKNGIFKEPKVQDVMEGIEIWQEQNQARLGKLATLIHKILHMVKCCDDRATVRYVNGSDKLIISPLEGKKTSPESFYLNGDEEPVPPSAVQETPLVNIAEQLLWANQYKSGLTIQVGETTYEGIDLKVMPYFATFLKGQSCTSRASPVVLKHASIPFFSEVVLGLAKGPREFFRLMPTRLSDYHVLCDTLEFLRVDMVEGQTLGHIMDNLKNGKSDSGFVVGGFKYKARNAAFRLLYMFLAKATVVTPLDKDMAYDAAFFVVSHRDTFRYRTRKMVREAFLERFEATPKQWANLNKWPIEDPSWPGSSDDDQTTEDEDYPESDGHSDYDSNSS